MVLHFRAAADNCYYKVTSLPDNACRILKMIVLYQPRQPLNRFFYTFYLSKFNFQQSIFAPFAGANLRPQKCT